MKRIRQNIRLVTAVVSALLLGLIAYGAYSMLTYGTRWFASGANKYVRQIRQNVIAGTIYDRNGEQVAFTQADGKRQYHRDETLRRSMVHVLGDSANHVAFGVESFMANYLYAFNDGFLQRLQAALNGEKRRGTDVVLTVDSRLSQYIAQQFPQQKNGAAVVLNYRTGEVLALESFPNFDPLQEIAAARQDPRKPFWNRATKWLSAPGSTFKVITAACGIENIAGFTTKTYYCPGSLPVQNATIVDAAGGLHHTIGVKKALSASCNITFAQVAMEVGDAALRQKAAAFGLNDYFLFRDLVVENSLYPLHNRSQKELAWTGVGQSALAVTPLHMGMVAAAIANDGLMMEPRLLLRAQTAEGVQRAGFEAREYGRPLTKNVADILADYMGDVVEHGTGQAAAVPGTRICGKTGSAQVDGQQQTNAWFIGFIDDYRYPYALCVVVEDAGSGSAVAAPLAGKIFRQLLGR